MKKVLKNSVTLMVGLAILSVPFLPQNTQETKAAGEYIIEPPCHFSKSISTMNSSTERNHPAYGSRPANHAVDIQLGSDCGNKNSALAVTDGTIIFKWGDYGYQAELATSDGKNILYGHLEGNSNLVPNGSKVRTGAPIAKIGCTGQCSGHHIHLEVRDENNNWMPNSSWLFGIRPYENDNTPDDNYNQTYGYAIAPAENLCEAGTEICPMYRFYSEAMGSHFYTLTTSERNKLLTQYPKSTWRYEHINFYAFPAQAENSYAVYRFWSPTYQSHFYTISESEKNKIIQNLSHVWQYEGIKFYAYKTAQPNSQPIYRFWSDSKQKHLFTSSESEKNKLINTMSNIWTYEGIKFYTPLPISE